MKSNKIILFFIFLISLNCQDHYHLSLETLSSRTLFTSLNEYNLKKEISPRKIYYTGHAKNIQSIINELNKYSDYPLILMFDNCNYTYLIKNFSKDTMFIVDSSCSIEKDNYTSYTIFTLGKENDILKSTVEDNPIYYLKLGRQYDLDIIYGLGPFALYNLILIVVILCYMNQKLTTMYILDVILVNYQISHISWFLFGCIVFNVSFYSILGKAVLDSIAEYLTLLMYTVYKSFFYSLSILLIQGWMTITFKPTDKTSWYFFKRLFLYELIFLFIINFSIYFVCFTRKLNLYYFKIILEQILSFAFIGYNFYYKIIPLYKQMNYVRNLNNNNNDLYECIKFKFIKMKKIYIFYSIYTIWNIIAPFIENKFIGCYYYDYFFHCTCRFFYEINFYLGLCIIFLPKTLPPHFYNEIIYNYQDIICYNADIKESNDKKDKNKLNINSLNKNKLKNNKFPILFINPFTSAKDQLLFNNIYIGNIE